MLNDFLASLASRAMHAAEADSAAGGLKPRLTSLFEPPAAPLIPPPHKIPESGDLVEVAALQAAQPQPVSQTPRQDQSEIQVMRPALTDEAAPNPSPGPRLQQDETTQFVIQNQSQTAPTIIERIRVEHYTEVPPAGSSPKTIESEEVPRLHRKKENDPQPVLLTPLIPPPVSLSAQDRALEILRRQDQKDALQASTAAPDRHRDISIKPALAPLPGKLASASVVPEQIVITRQELQSLKAGLHSQLVPAVAVPERKSQASMPQSEPQSPTIHVTIGRIEVKASTPATLPKRSVSAPAALSLEEYLRRRQGGSQ